MCDTLTFQALAITLLPSAPTVNLLFDASLSALLLQSAVVHVTVLSLPIVPHQRLLGAALTVIPVSVLSSLTAKLIPRPKIV